MTTPRTLGNSDAYFQKSSARNLISYKMEAYIILKFFVILV